MSTPDHWFRVLEYPHNHRLEDMPIDYLELEFRTVNILHRMGLKTVGELSRTSVWDIRRHSGVGKITIQNIRDVLHSLGLGLAA